LLQVWHKESQPFNRKKLAYLQLLQKGREAREEMEEDSIHCARSKCVRHKEVSMGLGLLIAALWIVLSLAVAIGFGRSINKINPDLNDQGDVGLEQPKRRCAT
jgi:hypothetical protein